MVIVVIVLVAFLSFRSLLPNFGTFRVFLINCSFGCNAAVGRNGFVYYLTKYIVLMKGL